MNRITGHTIRRRGGVVFAALVLVGLVLTGVGWAQAQAAPTVTTEPQITGTTAVGSTLTATTGAWNGSPTSYGFQWMRCPGSGGAADASDCAAISGATTSSYVLGSSDAGNTLRVRVTATNADGATTTASNATQIVTAASTVPTNTSQPQVSGSTVVGSTLTATTGTWTNSPTAYGFQWTRCPASGGAADASDCAAISGATTSSYVLGSSDAGSTLRVRVTATNADGATTAASNATQIVTAASTVPANRTQPQITGPTVVGSTLAATPGSWTNSPSSYTYRWTRCPATGGAPDASDCAAISGATTNRFVLGSADVGKRLRVRVTATNARGSATVASNATAIVRTAAPPPVADGCAKKGGRIPVTGVSAPARLTIDQTQISPNPISRNTRSITARFHVSACGGSVQGALVYVTAVPYGQLGAVNEQATSSDGWATLQLSTRAGFPVSNKQQLLVMFARARKNGENLLGGISTRRLVSFHVNRG